METSKERILKAIHHIQPEAVPINIEGICGIMPDVPLENVLAMYDEARKFIF
jgi:uroporphyrinogen-III decarboxylase